MQACVCGGRGENGGRAGICLTYMPTLCVLPGTRCGPRTKSLHGLAPTAHGERLLCNVCTLGMCDALRDDQPYGPTGHTHTHLLVRHAALLVQLAEAPRHEVHGLRCGAHAAQQLPVYMWTPEWQQGALASLLLLRPAPTHTGAPTHAVPGCCRPCGPASPAWWRTLTAASQTARAAARTCTHTHGAGQRCVGVVWCGVVLSGTCSLRGMPAGPTQRSAAATHTAQLHRTDAAAAMPPPACANASAAKH